MSETDYTWDDFEHDAEAASESSRGNGCSAGRLLSSLGAEALDVIEGALRREELTTPAILKAIKKRADTNVSAYTLRRHRRGDCGCNRNG